MESTLIVGAGGILAPAAATLVGEGAAVTGVGRRSPMPEDVERILVDARDLLALDAALAGRRWETAIVYEPAVTAHTLRRIEVAVAGRVVLVRTSAAADPARPVAPRPDALQLGWVDEGEQVRWHTAAEISDAALTVRAEGGSRTLGVVRPWGRRP